MGRREREWREAGREKQGGELRGVERERGGGEESEEGERGKAEVGRRERDGREAGRKNREEN